MIQNAHRKYGEGDIGALGFRTESQSFHHLGTVGGDGVRGVQAGSRAKALKQ